MRKAGRLVVNVSRRFGEQAAMVLAQWTLTDYCAQETEDVMQSLEIVSAMLDTTGLPVRAPAQQKTMTRMERLVMAMEFAVLVKASV